MGIKATGIGWGGLVMVPVATWLILAFDWRVAYASLGIGLLVINLPIVILLMRWLRPEDKGLLPDGKHIQVEEARAESNASSKQGPSGSAWTLKSASRTPAFYLLGISIYLVFVGQASIMFHGIPLFEGRGASPQIAASLMSTIAFLGIGGKLLAGYIADRVTARRVAIFVFSLHAAALIVLLNTEGVTALWLFVLMYGMALGGLGTLAPLLVGQFFGRASFCAIFGVIGIATTAGVGTGPTLIGFIYDLTGSYNPALIGYIFTHLLAAVLIFLARPPKLRSNHPGDS
jgi:sugar phosphate permease